MNCKEAQNSILLAGSNELPANRVQELEGHLAGCAACSAFSDSVRGVLLAVHKSLPGGEPSVKAMAAIRAEAAARTPERSGLIKLPRRAVEWLAYAAGILLIVGGWMVLKPAMMDRAGRILEVSALASLVTGELSAVGVHPPALETKKPDDHELKILARELLLMEGLAADEVVELEGPDFEFISDEEPSPTALQWHNTAGVPG